jgi:hypothetical protein
MDDSCGRDHWVLVQGEKARTLYTCSWKFGAKRSGRQSAVCLDVDLAHQGSVGLQSGLMGVVHIGVSEILPR